MILNCEIHGETEHVDFSWNESPPRCMLCFDEARQKSEEGEKRLAERRASRITSVYTLPLVVRIQITQIPEKFRAAEATPENKRWIKAHEASWGACLVLGNVGTGKTSQACGMLRHAVIQGGSALYTTARRMSRTINQDQSVEKYTGVQFLVIDEIDKDFDTELAKHRMFEVIDDRYVASKPVILVGNVDSNRLKKCIGIEAADRVREDLHIFTMSGQSRR